jgi:hypothetical protein
MSNKHKGRVQELGNHRVVVRKDEKRKSTDLDRKWRMACSCGKVDYFATSIAAEAAGEAHLSTATGVILHD